ncbi:hypothetical protein LCGC14_1941320 [marine sediment metagenome]|uniref:Uncharacterized protein n=1 Tax=marine sediment metagenome TaxID=412755 RepID=A0A0F9G8U0_9ZZZZ
MTIAIGKHYPARLTNGVEGVLAYNYWNANGKGVCIVAKEGGIEDWAAYIGADDGMREAECVEWTCRRGCKLSREQAHRWFPELPIGAYRE